MSRGKARTPSRASAARDDHEAIALRIHQIAAVAAAIAEAQEEPLSHALYLIEESLLEVEASLIRLGPPQGGRARRAARGRR